MARCEVCGSDDAAVILNLIGPSTATLCSVHFRAWIEYMHAEYEDLVVHLHLASGAFNRRNYPSYTGLADGNEEDIVRELLGVESELRVVWNNWLKEAHERTCTSIRGT